MEIHSLSATHVHGYSCWPKARKLSFYFTFRGGREEKRYFSHGKVPLFAWQSAAFRTAKYRFSFSDDATACKPTTCDFMTNDCEFSLQNHCRFRWQNSENSFAWRSRRFNPVYTLIIFNLKNWWKMLEVIDNFRTFAPHLKENYTYNPNFQEVKKIWR